MPFSPESSKNKSLIVKFFDYLTVVKKRNFFASFTGIKTSKLYTIQSSISNDLFFILEKGTSDFLAVSGYDRKHMVIGYNDLSKKVIDSKFEQFNGVVENITNEMLSYVRFLDISTFNPVLEKSSVHKYLMIINNVEYCIQKNIYIYSDHLNDDFTEYYYQEFYILVKNDELMFTSITPNFSLSIINTNNEIVVPTPNGFNQTNADLDLIYDGLVSLVKGTDRHGSKIVFNAEQTIQNMKEHYLDKHYHGWKELGYPQTPEDVQLLKMIAI